MTIVDTLLRRNLRKELDTFQRRILPAEELAKIEITAAIHRAFETSRDAAADKTDAQVDLTRTQEEATRLEGRIHSSRNRDTYQVVMAIAGLVAIAVMIPADILMVEALGTPWPLAILFGVLIQVGITGMSVWAHSLIRGGTDQARLGGIAVFAGLAVVAALLIPILASARAEETYGEELRNARSIATNASALGDNASAQDKNAIEQSKDEVLRLKDDQERLRNVFLGLLAAGIVIEIVCSPYAFDTPFLWRIRRLERRQRRAQEDIASADLDIQQSVADLQTDINDIAQKYGMSVDDISGLADARFTAEASHGAALLAAIQQVSMPPAPTPTPAPPSAASPRPTPAPASARVPATATTAPAAAHGPDAAPERPVGQPPAALAPGTAGVAGAWQTDRGEWDGVWA